MNDIRPRSETISLERVAAGAVARAAEVFPVVVVTGARQVGKSTLVRTMPQLTEEREPYSRIP